MKRRTLYIYTVKLRNLELDGTVLKILRYPSTCIRDIEGKILLKISGWDKLLRHTNYIQDINFLLVPRNIQAT